MTAWSHVDDEKRGTQFRPSKFTLRKLNLTGMRTTEKWSRIGSEHQTQEQDAEQQGQRKRDWEKQRIWGYKRTSWRIYVNTENVKLEGGTGVDENE